MELQGCMQRRRYLWFLSLCILMQCPRSMAAAASQGIEGSDSVPERTPLVHFSLTVRQADQGSDVRPSWCKNARTHGAWHHLSDDEYVEDLPQLQCAFPNKYKGDQAYNRVTGTSAEDSPGSQGQACTSILPVPKVALLFLTQGNLPHAALWDKWLGSIQGKIPSLCTANAICARGGYKALQDIRDACSTSNFSGNSYHRQLLYSAYVHSPPGVALFGPDHIFYGRDSLAPRFVTTWGDHSTVEVMRNLMGTALLDPLNQRFLTLSETCVPLYSPLVVYQQLMYETRSRISACESEPEKPRDISVERYNKRMARGHVPGSRIQEWQWRKHWQFFSLTRSHAELVAADTEVIDSFGRDCFVGPDPLHVDDRFCIGDEHYVSTLLAVQGLQWETDCLGALTHANWPIDDPHARHPKTYTPTDIQPVLIQAVRGSVAEAEAANLLSQKAFARAENMTAEDSSWYMPYPNIRKLRSNFPLFARKFTEDTASLVLEMFTKHDVEGFKLGIFSGAYKKDATHSETASHALPEPGQAWPRAGFGHVEDTDGHSGESTGQASGSALQNLVNEGSVRKQSQNQSRNSTLEEGGTPQQFSNIAERKKKFQERNFSKKDGNQTSSRLQNRILKRAAKSESRSQARRRSVSATGA